MESQRTPYLLKLNSNSSKCILCQLQLDLKHTVSVIIINEMNCFKSFHFKKLSMVS